MLKSIDYTNYTNVKVPRIDKNAPIGEGCVPSPYDYELAHRQNCNFAKKNYLKLRQSQISQVVERK
jgi:hypothetical protein